MRLEKILELDTENEFKNLVFPPYGTYNQVGITAPGVSQQYGPDQMWEQDSSIMGWTCGYLVASAKDVAKFYWNLLGPNNSILSPEALKE
jgi:hypothetical protein